MRRTALHGICLTSGRHTPGSVWAAECPLLNADKRRARSEKAAQTRWKRRGQGVERVDARRALEGSS
jgi:hypothetical protein